MSLSKSFVTKSISTLFFTLISSASFAGSVSVGTMTYSIPPANSNPTAVPTLSGMMIVLLSLLLFAVAFRIAKQKNNSASKFFISLIGVAALLTGVGGLKLVSDVNAGLAPPTTIPMALNTGPTTGSVKLFNTSNYFDNPHAVPATITSISVTNTFFSCSPNFQLSAKTIDVNAPFCSDIAPNNIVQPGAQCKIQCYSVDNIDGSDIRLKQDINFLTKLKNGIKLYSFTYLPSYSAGDTEYVGVMAQDLLKDERYKGAVSRMDNGYYAVNYKTIGLEMKTLEEWKQSAR